LGAHPSAGGAAFPGDPLLLGGGKADPSTSMLPTLKIGDRLIIDKFSFKFNGVSRGSMGSKGTSDCVKCPLPK